MVCTQSPRSYHHERLIPERRGPAKSLRHAIFAMPGWHSTMTNPANRIRSPLITIIVAAYNVESYVEDALTSLLSQPGIDAVDIIVVDDGSQDQTYAVIKGAMDADGGRHVRLIHQSNRGLSDARNTGLTFTRTPYVGFLDGDDMVGPEFLSAILPLLSGDWDMLEYNVTVIDDRNKPLLDINVVAPTFSGGHPVGTREVMHFADRFHSFIWARVYRTALFDTDPFPIGRQYEDAAVLPSVYLRARSIYYLNQPLICYRRRFGSITQNHCLKQVCDLHVTGCEALARCHGGERDEFWRTVYRKLFERACHVSARVEGATFRDSLRELDHMAADYRSAANGTVREPKVATGSFGRLALAVCTDRLVYLIKQLGKKVLGRSLYRAQRQRTAMMR
jgi:glycosyltransferase involved in cell wall biosynthesis